ncbi:unnamed protein product [Closterium sp. NIES-65]|nr:unnamed protein product [Closterium sp. NIES-65]
MFRGLLGVAVFVRVCLSPPSSCTIGTIAISVALLHLRALLLGVLLLASLELGVVLVLCLLEVLVSLVLEVLVLGVLELLGLTVVCLRVLLLVALRLETLGLEVLVLGVLHQEGLEVLRVLELLEVLELLRVLELLEVLELLRTLELLEVLELLRVLDLLEVLELLRVLELLEVLELLKVLELLVLVLSLSSSTGLPLQPGSHLPAPSPYTKQTGGLAISPVRSGRSSRRVPRQRQPAVPDPSLVVRRPSSPPQRVPLPSPPTSSLPVVTDPESDRIHAEHPTVTRLLATVVTDPSFESTAAFAFVAELVDFAAACRLDYAASLVAESESVCPPSVGVRVLLARTSLRTGRRTSSVLRPLRLISWPCCLPFSPNPDAPDIPTPRSYAEAIAGEYSSQWQTAMDAGMASWKTKGTYVDEVPPLGANIISGMWIFRVKPLPGSPPIFKARYVARGFSQQEGVDFFQTFSPNPKMTTLQVLLHVAAQRDYELHSLDFSTAFLQGSLHEEIWLRRPPGFTRSFPPGTQWSLRRPVYGLRQAPREWHDTLRMTLAALGFAPLTADPSLFLRTDTSLPPFYILVYVDDLVFATADTKALALVKSELQKRHTCTDLG